MITTYCKRYSVGLMHMSSTHPRIFLITHPLNAFILAPFPSFTPIGRAIPSVFDPSRCPNHPRQPPPRQAMVHGPRRSLDHRHHDHPHCLLRSPFRNARRCDDGLEPGQGVLGSSDEWGLNCCFYVYFFSYCLLNVYMDPLFFKFLSTIIRIVYKEYFSS